MVFGTFDFFHPGHRFLIEEARKLGNVTVVVARGTNVKEIKGRPPKETDEKRLGAIKEAFPDVTVVLGSSEDFLEPIRTQKPDLLLLGYDQRLPPGVKEESLPTVKRAPPHHPEKFKSSLMQ